MEPTPSLKLAQEYVRLGGTRKSKIDDNITSIRKWEDEPQEASRFWEQRIAVLDADERKQVEDFLPSMHSD